MRNSNKAYNGQSIRHSSYEYKCHSRMEIRKKSKLTKDFSFKFNGKHSMQIPFTFIAKL